MFNVVYKLNLAEAKYLLVDEMSRRLDALEASLTEADTGTDVPGISNIVSNQQPSVVTPAVMTPEVLSPSAVPAPIQPPVDQATAPAALVSEVAPASPKATSSEPDEVSTTTVDDPADA